MILSDIIKPGTDFSGGDSFFNDGIRVYDLGQRAHLLKEFHRICIVGPSEKISPEGSIWRGNRVVVYFIINISIFLYFDHEGVCNLQQLY